MSCAPVAGSSLIPGSSLRVLALRSPGRHRGRVLQPQQDRSPPQHSGVWPAAGPEPEGVHPLGCGEGHAGQAVNERSLHLTLTHAGASAVELGLLYFMVQVSWEISF